MTSSPWWESNETRLCVHQEVDKGWLRAVLAKEAGKAPQAPLQWRGRGRGRFSLQTEASTSGLTPKKASKMHLSQQTKNVTLYLQYMNGFPETAG